LTDYAGEVVVVSAGVRELGVGCLVLELHKAVRERLRTRTIIVLRSEMVSYAWPGVERIYVRELLHTVVEGGRKRRG